MSFSISSPKAGAIPYYILGAAFLLGCLGAAYMRVRNHHLKHCKGHHSKRALRWTFSVFHSQDDSNGLPWANNRYHHHFAAPDVEAAPAAARHHRPVEPNLGPVTVPPPSVVSGSVTMLPSSVGPRFALSTRSLMSSTDAPSVEASWGSHSSELLTIDESSTAVGDEASVVARPSPAYSRRPSPPYRLQDPYSAPRYRLNGWDL